MPWSKERRKEANAIRPAGTNRLCCVPLCDYNTLAYWRRPGAQLRSMHMFPNDHVRRQQWVENIQRRQPDGMPWEPAEASRVCSTHFSEACFLDRFIARGVKYRGRARVNKRLANFSIPTIFPGYPPDIIVPHQIVAGAKHFTPDMKRTRKRREDNQMLNTPIGSFDSLVHELRDKVRLAPHWHIYRTGIVPQHHQQQQVTIRIPDPNAPDDDADQQDQQQLLEEQQQQQQFQQEQQQQPQDEQEQDNTITLTCLNYANIEQPRVVGWIIIDETLDTIVHVPGSIALEARLQNIIMMGGRTRNNVEDYKPEEGAEHRLVTWTQLARLVREIERPVKIEMAERSAAMSFYNIAGGDGCKAEPDQDIKPAVSIGSLVDVQGANGQHVSGRIISVTSHAENRVQNNYNNSSRLILPPPSAMDNKTVIMPHSVEGQQQEMAVNGTAGPNGDEYDDDEMFADAEAAAGDTSQQHEHYEDDTDEEEQAAYEDHAYMDAYQQQQQHGFGGTNRMHDIRNASRMSSDRYQQQHAASTAPYRLYGGKIVNIMAPKMEVVDEDAVVNGNNGRYAGGRNNKGVVYASSRVKLVMGSADEEGEDEQMEQGEAEEH